METIQMQCLVRVPIPHASISPNLPSSSSSSTAVAVANPPSVVKAAILYTPSQVVVPKQKQLGRRRRIGHNGPSLAEKNPRVEEVLQKMKDPSITLQDALPDKAWESLYKWDFFSILDHLQHQHNVKRSLELFELMKRQAWYIPNSRVYARMIAFLGRENMVDHASHLFEEMVQEGCKPSQYACTAMLNAYAKAKKCVEASALFEYMRTSEDLDCRPNVISCNTYMDCLLKRGHYDDALHLFTQMEGEGGGLDPATCRPNEVSYNIVLDYLCKEGEVEEAIRLLHRMNQGPEEVKPSVWTYNIVIGACGKVGLGLKADLLMKEMVERGLQPDRITYTGVIEGFGKAGLWKSAEAVFQGMIEAKVEVDVMAYTVMLDAYAWEGMYEKAEGLLESMKGDGVNPSEMSYCSVVDAYGKSGRAEAAERLLEALRESGYKANVYMYNALIHAYGKAGKYAEAARIFRSMKEGRCQPNWAVYTALLSTCACCPTWEDACTLLDCLAQSGRRTDATLDVLLRQPSESQLLWQDVISLLTQLEDQPKSMALPFYNSMLDVLWSFGLKQRSTKLLALGKSFGVYPSEFGSFLTSKWFVDLHTLSVGAALLALGDWLTNLYELWLSGNEEVPSEVRVVVGKGKRSRSRKSALKTPTLDYLNDLGSPFQVMEANEGALHASGAKVKAWILSDGVKEKLELVDSFGLEERATSGGST